MAPLSHCPIVPLQSWLVVAVVEKGLEVANFAMGRYDPLSSSRKTDVSLKFDMV